MSNTRYGLGGLLALALTAGSGAASANGRAPGANDVVFNRNDPNHMILRTTYGFNQTKDGGATWQWFCEGALGIPSVAYDPPLGLVGDGTAIIAAGAFAGVATSRDSCNWSPSPALMAGQLVRDVTNLPSNPGGLLVLTSTFNANKNPAAPYDTFIFQTLDNGRTWALKSQLVSNILVQTLEVAPSAPNRIYVSGNSYEIDPAVPPVGIFLKTEDAGATWTTVRLPLPTPRSSTFISAIDPNNADRIYLRVPHEADDPNATGVSPTVLRVSHDKGATWQDIFDTNSRITTPNKSMFGFALSPDGQRMVFGGLFGVWAGAAPAGPFTPINSMQNRCLRWTAQGIYACASEPTDPFSLGVSTDGGSTFRELYRRVDETCPITCEPGTSVYNVCRLAWDNPNDQFRSVKYLLDATEASCHNTPGGCTSATITPARTSSPARLALPASVVAAGGVLFAIWWRRRRPGGR